MSAVMDGTESFDGPPPALLQAFLDDYERFVAYFRTHMARRDEAMDLVHDMYLSLRQIPSGRVIDKVAPYLWTVARNTLCHYLERNGRTTAFDPNDLAMEVRMAQLPTDDDDIDQAIRVAALRASIARLPPKRRAVMELNWNHEIKRADIAKHLDISEDTVKKHLKRGLVDLRQDMQQLEASHGTCPESEE
jgi:RNA polymerase sigma factor (sigma-70 family)